MLRQISFQMNHRIFQPTRSSRNLPRGKKSIRAVSCRVVSAAAIPVGRLVEHFLFLRPVRTNPPQSHNVVTIDHYRIRGRNTMSLNVINNATCTFCGCVCDDIQLHFDETRIHEARKACVLGKAWFLNHTADHDYPDALIDGHEASVDDAIEAAATYLHDAHMPLIYGLSNTTCEAQREAVSLADRLGGLLDSHTSL